MTMRGGQTSSKRQREPQMALEIAAVVRVVHGLPSDRFADVTYEPLSALPQILQDRARAASYVDLYLHGELEALAADGPMVKSLVDLRKWLWDPSPRRELPSEPFRIVSTVVITDDLPHESAFDESAVDEDEGQYQSESE